VTYNTKQTLKLLGADSPEYVMDSEDEIGGLTVRQMREMEYSNQEMSLMKKAFDLAARKQREQVTKLMKKRVDTVVAKVVATPPPPPPAEKPAPKDTPEGKGRKGRGGRREPQLK
jgi:hypothetical protein